MAERGLLKRIVQVDDTFYHVFPRGSEVVVAPSGHDVELPGFPEEYRCTGVKDAIALMALAGHLAKAKITVSVYDHAFVRSQQDILSGYLIISGAPPHNSVADAILEKCVSPNILRFDFPHETIVFNGKKKIDTKETVRGVIACVRNPCHPDVSTRVLLLAGVHQLGTHLAISYFINRDVQRAIRDLVDRRRNLNWAILVRGHRMELDIEDARADATIAW